MQARRLSLLCVLATLSFSGCHELNLTKRFDKDENLRKNVRGALKGDDGHSRLIGDYIKIADSTLGAIKVQGVALVDRLDGTGEDPPASPNRTSLLEDMRKHGIKDPNSLLRSSNTALVVVTAWIPPIVKKGDKLDVEVVLPEGSESTSLAGGWVMPCHLQEHAMLDGAVREGREIAIATGPILIDALGEAKGGNATGHRRGRIPAGATYMADDRHLTIAIRNDYRTVRMSSSIAQRIGRRFHDYDEYGIQRPLAKAKSDWEIELIVADRYRDNYQRYLQCIRHMRLFETAVEKHIRLQELTDEIQFGPTAERAALQLEAIGPEAIPTLKMGLAAPEIEARFHAGTALAYLGNTDGIPALKEAAEKEPAFRIFALAALAALQDGSSGMALRDLMNHESVETRYGAFRAYSTMSPNDPYIRGIDMPGNFSLHLVDSTADPLIHLTRHKKAEIVVFNAEQQFHMPLILRAGNRILLQGNPRTNQVVIKRIAAGEPEQTRTVSSRVTDVIKGASDLGATYPDIVQMLVQARQQHNLPGQIAIDTLPRPGRTYTRPTSDREVPASMSGRSSSGSVQVGAEGLTPNMFDGRPLNGDDPEEKPSEKPTEKPESKPAPSEPAKGQPSQQESILAESPKSASSQVVPASAEVPMPEAPERAAPPRSKSVIKELQD